MTKKMFLISVLTIFALSIFVVAAPVGERSPLEVLEKCHTYCADQFKIGIGYYLACFKGCVFGATL